MAKIQTFFGNAPLTNATGFFFLHEKFLYLVTSRHVVRNELAGHAPDQLRVWLHTEKHDLRQSMELTVPLYAGGLSQWLEHPLQGGAVDLVLVPINDPGVLGGHFIDTFTLDDIVPIEEPPPLGQEVLIVGFPLGFHDTLHNLPIVRSATLASSYAHPFKGEPYFLTDARMHRGTSGSPVIGRWGDPEDRASRDWRLLGIHSAAIDVSDRDPSQDEKLGLNTTWYAALIPQMLPRKPAPPSRGEGEKKSKESKKS